ncbi:MAG TPA: hypothetical protein VKB86_11115 [Pyrinomonadaceae bacterium]|nr:hypothetical protein [Pyrinomonadaceae bacterium]
MAKEIKEATQEFTLTKESHNQAVAYASDAPKRGTMLGRVLAIARNTFREAVRDRVLYNLVLFVLLLIVGAIF